MDSSYTYKKLIGQALNYSMMVILAAIFIFPIYNMVRVSLSGISGRAFGFSAYAFVLQDAPFARYTSNSLLIAGITILIGLLVNSHLAYVLARLRWRWTALIVALIVALMIIPFEALAVPLLLLTNQFGWLDSLHVQIIPFIADPFSVFLFYQFFLRFPREVEDAALVDGLGKFLIFWRIILPNATPVIASAAILRFLFLWDSFLWPIMVTRGEAFRPLTVGILGMPGLPVASAYGTLMTIPTLILFLILQKRFVESLASSGMR